MEMTLENKKFLVYIAKYLGVRLISGSVVHFGTLETGGTRYLLAVGCWLFAVGCWLLVWFL